MTEMIPKKVRFCQEVIVFQPVLQGSACLMKKTGFTRRIHSQSSSVSFSNQTYKSQTTIDETVTTQTLMDYYKHLNQADFVNWEEYMVERVRLGLNAGYTFTECQNHWLGDLADALGLDGNKYRVDRDVLEEQDEKLQYTLNNRHILKNLKEIDRQLTKEIEQIDKGSDGTSAAGTRSS